MKKEKHLPKIKNNFIARPVSFNSFYTSILPTCFCMKLQRNFRLYKKVRRVLCHSQVVCIVSLMTRVEFKHCWKRAKLESLKCNVTCLWYAVFEYQIYTQFVFTKLQLVSIFLLQLIGQVIAKMGYCCHVDRCGPFLLRCITNTDIYTQWHSFSYWLFGWLYCSNLPVITGAMFG